MTTPQPRRWRYGDLSGARLGRYCRASDDPRETEQSVTGQDAKGRDWGERHGCVAVEPTFVDNDLSASWYATRPREDFEKLLQVIGAGGMDLLWMWHLSRSNRNLADYVRLRDACRRTGVGWIIRDRLFDLNDPMDLQALGYDAVNNETYSITLSSNVRRGKELSAAAGMPSGRLNYGYRRVYDGRGRYVEQLPDDALRQSPTGHWYSPAGVVRDIITGIGEATDVIVIVRRLNGRGIPAPAGGQWSRTTVRKIARNRVYLGRLVRLGEVLDLSVPPWPALVTEEEFYAAQNVLDDPDRRKAKPSKAKHLLSYIARAHQCGGHLRAYTQKVRPDGTRIPGYMCSVDSCATIQLADLDDFAERAVVRYLTRESVYQDLLDCSGDAEVAEIRGTIERLTNEVETWRRLGEEGADAVTVVRSVNGLKERITELEQKLETRALPPVLRGRIGPGLADAWDDYDLAVQREMIRVTADIRIKPVGKGRRNVPLDGNRLAWRWLIGPDAGAGI